MSTHAERIEAIALLAKAQRALMLSPLSRELTEDRRSADMHARSLIVHDVDDYLAWVRQSRATASGLVHQCQ